MPQRPRSHVLESESRTAFRLLMEARGWVVRAVDSPDYGVDDQVEVFAPDGSATGLTFYVQVRATDEESLHTALAVRVRDEQQAYFGALGDPVLVVRYHAPSRRLFGQWFHRVDPYYQAGSGTIRISEASEITANAVRGLADEVALVRTLRSSRVSWPLTVTIRCGSQHQARNLAIAMAAIAGDRYLNFTTTIERSTAVTVRLKVVAQGDTLIVHGGLVSTTIHADNDARPIEEVAADAVLGLAVALGSLEHLDAATALIKRAAPRAPGTRSELLVKVSGVLARGHRMMETLRIARVLLDDGYRLEAKFLSSMVSLALGDELEADERRTVADWNLHLAGAAESASDVLGAAADYYSAGNWLFHVVGDYEGARAAYVRAVELDATYQDRNYYIRERAAVHFECGDFSDATAWYRRAMAVHPTENGLAFRLADALAFDGRYSEALEQSRRYTDAPESTEPVWSLKTAVLRFLVEERGFSEQNRSSSAADELARSADRLTEQDQRLERFFDALALDALCGRAWHGILQILAYERRELVAAVGPVLILALEAKRPEVWAEALLVTLGAGEVDLAHQVASAALWAHDSAFVDAVRSMSSTFPAELRDDILDLVEMSRSSVVRSQRGFTVRTRDDRGDATELSIGPR